jgi:uncharacterized lipoprotein YddW (UPF0748 family)
MLNKTIIILPLLLLAGCASQSISKVPDGMRVATNKEVEQCEHKGDVHGVSLLYGAFAEVALSKARQQAFNQAKGMGANTVVFEPFRTEAGATSVHGNAYSCS